MTDIKLNDNNDIAIENNDIVFITSIDEVRQRLLENLNTFKGEWFLDLEMGIPYYQDISKKNIDLNVIESVFKDAILDSPGVLELLDFSLDIDNSSRQLDVNFTARASEGEIVINLPII